MMYAFHLKIKLHVKDNVPGKEALAATERVKRIYKEREALEKRWQDVVNA
jgi:hypothetical protein